MLRHLGARLAQALVVLLPAAGLATPAATVEGNIDFCGQSLKRNERYVQCHNPRVTDIAPLASLPDLEHLDLGGSGISSCPGSFRTDFRTAA